MELVFAKSAHMALSGFCFGAFFKGFRLVDDLIRTGTKPCVEDIALTRPPGDTPGALQRLLRNSIARSAEYDSRGACATLDAAGGRKKLAHRAGAFLLSPPLVPAAPWWVSNGFLSAGTVDAYSVPARIAVAALVEGGRTAKVLGLGTAMAGAVGLARHGREQYDRILDWQFDPTGAAVGLAAGMYAFSPAEPRLGRAATSCAVGLAFFYAAKGFSARKGGLWPHDSSRSSRWWG